MILQAHWLKIFIIDLYGTLKKRTILENEFEIELFKYIETLWL